jgi:hypothetical protein
MLRIGIQVIFDYDISIRTPCLNCELRLTIQHGTVPMQSASDAAPDSTAYYRDDRRQIYASLWVARTTPRKKPQPEANSGAHHGSDNPMAVFKIFGSHFAHTRPRECDDPTRARAAVRAPQVHIRHIQQITVVAPASDHTDRRSMIQVQLEERIPVVCLRLQARRQAANR